MPEFAVITENDESAWQDEAGVLYHFPNRYRKHLQPGTRVVYYKGRMTKSRYRDQRLSPKPHYFATAAIGSVSPDSNSSKNDYFASIVDFQTFTSPVLAKEGDDYLETIPESRQSNYWRDGVRPIDASTYRKILRRARISIRETESPVSVSDNSQGLASSLTSGVEGQPKLRFVTTYERDPRLRAAAIKIHGLRCIACKFDFEKTYGAHGSGYIHVHHLKPLSDLSGPVKIDPKTDLTVLCANCHSMVHRNRNNTLSIEELKRILSTSS